jgi:MarR family transcriptional regulator, organic hydroperoxide resistance regulator
MGEKPNKKEVQGALTREDISFDIKVTWLAIAKMFAPLAVNNRISVSMGFVLLNISKEHGAPATKIAPLLGMEPRSLTRMLKKLEEMKLIVRTPDAVDGRSVRIFLTEKGLEMRKVAREDVETFNAEVKRAISPGKLETFFQVLEEIHQVIEKHKTIV